MNNQKNIYLIIMMFLGFLLYVQWQKDYAQPNESTTTVQTTHEQNQDTPQLPNETPMASNDADIPQPTAAVSQTETPQVNNSPAATTDVISRVETPLLKLEFSAEGGALVYAELKQYPLKKNEAKNVILMDYRNQPYRAESGLVGSQINFTHKDIFTTEQAALSVSEQPVDLVFTSRKDGATLTKTYQISPDSYAIKVSQRVTNQTGQSISLSDYQQIKRNNPWENVSTSFTNPGRYSFKGAGYFDTENGYETLDFSDLEEEKINKTMGPGAWIAMVQHYFFTGIVPEASQVSVQTQYTAGSQYPYLIRYITPAKNIAQDTSEVFNSTWFVGPKLQDELPAIAKGLDLTVDYGVFTAISKPLFWLLEKIHGFVGNWGWAIVLLTILIKLVFFKLSEAQYKSMARMRKLQPRITTLKERYKDDKPKFNQEMMALYQKEKVNPLGGCLPILIQIPVFIALYWVLLESVELRQAPFILWIQDLSSPDPYFILPAINAAAMVMTQRLSPTPGMDPMQQKIMKFMPIAFSVMFAFFQAGLVLYWALNSVLSLAQQWVITRRIDAQDDNKPVMTKKSKDTTDEK
ncbi:membrane protein insertase YidC [Marinicella gelatinilytica]|uniref:membrane protein insertase YidC n=1 Tax=Marinicella gelatinilytica TaxID=2996017 RepID=UPI0022608634|nr:membrane protein insertase YidC [Marinicella gelatinilytica]MCX7545389.1 membrane protein insertase YidC [Marinicella gelatinilytica]